MGIILKQSKIFYLITTVILSTVVFYFFAPSEPLAAGTIYYVDASRSNDNGDGRSWSQAERTLQAGINHLSAGDELRIKTGTYPGGALVDNVRGTAWTPGNYILVRSDDGNGNYDQSGVIIKGSHGVTWGAPNDSPFAMEDCSYWKFEYLTFTGESSRGNDCSFVAEAASNSRKGLWFNQVTFNGNPSEFLLSISTIPNVLIENSDFDCTGCNTGEGSMIMIQRKNDGDWGNDVVFRNNDIQGSFGGDEYGALTVKRTKNIEIYNNYFHDINRTRTICIRHADPTTHIYNNVIELSGNTGDDLHVIAFRGMTGGTQSGLCGVHSGYVYHNTIDMNRVTADQIFMGKNDQQDCVIQNNLILDANTGQVILDQVDGSYLSQCYSSGEWADNNVMRYVFVEGNIVWEDPPNTGWTLSNNLENIGNVILGTGAKPYPYYSLTQSFDGTSLFPTILVDYNKDTRAATPDVGAFEYDGASPQPCLSPDLDCDQDIDFQDFTLFQSYWTSQNLQADFNNDSIINTQDFAIMMSTWGSY